MIDMTTSLLIFLSAVILLFVVAPSKLKMWRRAVLMVAIAGCGVLAHRSINARAGLPVPIPALKKEVLIIAFLEDKSANKIYVWLRLADSQVPKTFSFKHDEKTAKQLRGLRAKHKGKPFYADVDTTEKKKGGGGFSRMDEGDAWFQIDDSIKLPKKDP